MSDEICKKKKTKLTISGNPKKSISNIDLARSQNKNSVVIEKKPTRFANSNLNRKPSSFKPRFNQNTNLNRTEDVLVKKPQKTPNDYEKRKLAEQSETKKVKGNLSYKDLKGKTGTKKRELK